jgi:small subunit ribosomal protein S8
VRDAKLAHSQLDIGLKYYAGRPVIEKLERNQPAWTSRLQCRSDGIPKVMKNGLGVAIVSTLERRS